MKTAFLILVLLCKSAIAATYSTTFAGANERPLSESGNWINGATTGLDWSDCQLTNSGATHLSGAYILSDPSGLTYTDSTAVLSGAWASTQTNNATVFFAPGWSRNGEIELRLRTTITAHSITGYELDYNVATSGATIFMVRWNGPYGNFTSLGSANITALSTGDVLSGSASGSTINAYINGVLVKSVTDSTYSGGSPGIGFDIFTSNIPQDNGKYGFTSFFAQDFPYTVTNTFANCFLKGVQNQ